MHCSIGEPTVVNNIHAYPYIHVTKYFLLIFLVVASMIQENAMEEVFFVDLREEIHFNRCLTVTAQSSLDIFLSTQNITQNDVIARLQIDFKIDIAAIANCKAINILVVIAFGTLLLLGDD
jgi:hypothetical protein